MRFLLIAWLALAGSACRSRKAYTSDRIFDACLASEKTDGQCKRSVGCAPRLSNAECRKSFKNRHKFYIDYH